MTTQCQHHRDFGNDVSMLRNSRHALVKAQAARLMAVKSGLAVVGRLRACPGAPICKATMTRTLEPRLSATWAALSTTESLNLLETALKLRHAALSGQTQSLLRGRKLGLLCVDLRLPEARLFVDAASELGAHVAHLNLKPGPLAVPDELDPTARLLGRLYDAVECQDMEPEAVRRLAWAADTVVFDGLATAAHPTAALATQMGSTGNPADNRRFVLQAVLLKAIT